MDKQERTKEIIIKAMEEKLLHNDANSVSIDAVSKELRISKRTIYELFKSKDEIFEIIAERIQAKCLAFSQTIINKIRSKESSFTDGMLEVMQFNSKHIYMKNIIKNLPHIQLKIKKDKSNFFSEIYDLAVENDIVRKDVNKEIFFMVINTSLNAMLDPIVRQEYNILDSRALRDLHDIIMNGVLTDDGKHLMKYVNEIC